MILLSCAYGKKKRPLKNRNNLPTYSQYIATVPATIICVTYSSCTLLGTELSYKRSVISHPSLHDVWVLYAKHHCYGWGRQASAGKTIHRNITALFVSFNSANHMVLLESKYFPASENKQLTEHTSVPFCSYLDWVNPMFIVYNLFFSFFFYY